VAYLDSAGVAHAGTGNGESGLFRPALVSAGGIRLAVFAVTDIMNATGDSWKKNVAYADTAALLPAVRSVRDSVDAVIVSYHGGEEYSGRATARTRGFVRDVLGGGVDLFIGHHPHVPYGLDAVGNRLGAHSLGNFVFRQPSRYWTRFGFALAATIIKDSTGTHMQQFRCLPLRADFQPSFLAGGDDAARILGRVRLLSTAEASEKITW
jgi:poly-gamma-glutamate synthesis protein (capsule biosynthesis protein)